MVSRPARREGDDSMASGAAAQGGRLAARQLSPPHVRRLHPSSRVEWVGARARWRPARIDLQAVALVMPQADARRSLPMLARLADALLHAASGDGCHCETEGSMRVEPTTGA